MVLQHLEFLPVHVLPVPCLLPRVAALPAYTSQASGIHGQELAFDMSKSWIQRNTANGLCQTQALSDLDPHVSSPSSTYTPSSRLELCSSTVRSCFALLGTSPPLCFPAHHGSVPPTQLFPPVAGIRAPSPLFGENPPTGSSDEHRSLAKVGIPCCHSYKHSGPLERSKNDMTDLPFPFTSG